MVQCIFVGRDNLDDSYMGGDLMDPIAVVTWTDAQGDENRHPCFNTNSLNAFIANLQQKDYMYIVCMTSVNAAMPFRPPQRHSRAI